MATSSSTSLGFLATLESFEHTLAMATSDEDDFHPRLTKATKALCAVYVEACVPEAFDKVAFVDYIVENDGLRPFRRPLHPPCSLPSELRLVPHPRGLASSDSMPTSSSISPSFLADGREAEAAGGAAGTGGGAAGTVGGEAGAGDGEAGAGEDGAGVGGRGACAGGGEAGMEGAATEGRGAEAEAGETARGVTTAGGSL